jgi:hypothetical protein
MTPQQTMYPMLAFMAMFMALIAFLSAMRGLRNKAPKSKVIVMAILGVGFMVYAAAIAT